MAKPKEAEATTLTSGGVAIEGKVLTGKNTKLSAKEQGQLARGEIDESGEPTGKEVKPLDALTKVSKPTETLYQGKISAEAIAGATGEKVSVVMVINEPTTEHGLFYNFTCYHPSAIRETFKIDLSNTIDPTLRTHLE